jgi:dTDP-4-dehydrorhamnose reductase
MPLMYGIAGPTAKNFFSIHLDKLKRGEELSLFTDEWRTPLSGTSAAIGLLLAVSSFHGLYHLGGRERISRYGLGQLMAEAAHIPQPHIKPAQQADVTMAAPRPADISMNSDKAMALGFAPLSVREELRIIFSA